LFRESESDYQPQTAAELLRRPVPPCTKEICRIARDICRALHVLHATCIHRDIKPENILLVGRRWKLADLGQVIEYDHDRGGPCGTRGHRLENARPGCAGKDLVPLGRTLRRLLTRTEQPDDGQYLDLEETSSGSGSERKLCSIVRKAC